MSIIGSANAFVARNSRSGYKIERSLRFNSADSAYLNRTFGSGNQQLWTWSGWVKRSALGTNQNLFGRQANDGGATIGIIWFNSSDILEVINKVSSTTGAQVTCNAVFRDVSAWYHIVVAYDGNQSTAANMLKVWVNSVSQTYSSTVRVGAGNGYINVNLAHAIGRRENLNDAYLDGYLTEINFIDGQALTPSSFGETDTITGVWKPKKYAGTYGTNGFYLNFSDNSGTTSTTLGKDSSGNGNNFTPNNFSVTAGAGNDSMIDTPTPYADGGNGRGNYCTLNPLRTALTPTNGNLTITGNNTWRGTAATMQIPASGLYYFEVSTSTANQRIVGGLVTETLSMSSTWQVTTGFVGVAADSGNFNVMNNVSAGGTYLFFLSGTGASEVIGFAINATTGNMWFSRNNVWYNSTGSTTGDPAAGTNPTWTGLTASNYFPAAQCYDNAVDVYVNFGQRPFAYTPPSGFKALNTQNLPEPSIKKPNQWFDATVYTGDGTDPRPLTNSGLMQPDLVWIKSRGSSTLSDHVLNDSVRGATNDLFANLTAAEQANNSVRSFNSNGFSVGNSTRVNQSSIAYVGWQWKESATPGFDIVTYTGNSSARTISHSLGVTPSFIIVKRRSTGTTGWPVYHISFGNTGGLYLNTTAAAFTAAGFWNNTTPTSSVFTIGTDVEVNNNGSTYVAYLWSEVAGFSKFGSYTGNGSSDGPFVFCGFRPRWIMVKGNTSGNWWAIYDTARNTYNVMNSALAAQASDAEYSYTSFDALSNGFKLRSTGGDVNTSSNTYYFAAFAEAPFKYALAR